MSSFADRIIDQYLRNTNYVPTSTSAPSGRLWSRVAKYLIDGGDRLVAAGDDFLAPLAGNTSTEIYSEMTYTGYIDTSNTIVGLADESGGVLALTTDATDNDEVWIQSGDATSVLGAISDTAGSSYLTAFEARVKKSSIADNVAATFVGLCEEGTAGADGMADNTGVMADKDHIGFSSVHADGDAIDFVYKKAGQTAQTLIADVDVPVADTFANLGFIFDPHAPASERITVYVDNVASTTYGTATNIAAATFPDAEELGFLMGLKNGAATAAEHAIDWWMFAQIIT